MFPSSDDEPTHRRELGVGVSVASDVLVELRTPVRRVRGRVRAVIGTPMPEATVDVQRHTGAREHRIGLSPPAAAKPDRVAFDESPATPVQDRPYRRLRRAVSPPVCPHDRGRRRRTRLRPVRIRGFHRSLTLQGTIRNDQRRSRSAERTSHVSAGRPAATVERDSRTSRPRVQLRQGLPEPD